MNIMITLDAPVVSDCTDGDIRLTGAPTSQEGTIEICISNVWGGICQYSWGSTDANVACSQLGYQPVGNDIVASLLLFLEIIIPFCRCYCYS